MQTYLAFLRGVNVGGRGMIRMTELKTALEKSGLSEVRTYIQSGNVVFTSSEKNIEKLAKLIKSTIQKHFKLPIDIAIFTKAEWQDVIEAAPTWWGKDMAQKHNLWILIKPTDMKEVVAAIGALKPDIEMIEAGKGVLYQSMSFQVFGRTSTSKVVNHPLYKQVTIRNYNTANKLLTFMA